jgi:hypothetical protein
VVSAVTEAIKKLASAAVNLRAATARHGEVIGSERAYDVAWLLWARGEAIPDRLRRMI